MYIYVCIMHSFHAKIAVSNTKGLNYNTLCDHIPDGLDAQPVKLLVNRSVSRSTALIHCARLM